MTKEMPQVQRYFGSETEYSFTRKKTYQSSINYIPVFPGVPQRATFLGNGGRLYLDMGLVEYATPECATLDQLVTHELAGEALVAYSASKIPQIGSLFKRAASPNGRLTYGSHENYSTSVNVTTHEEAVRTFEIDVLAAHFATRTIYTGAGIQLGENDYKLSQKMQGITKVVGNGNTSHKALVNTRQEHWNGTAKEKRLHVVCGDANLSPWAIKLKFGTTSLVLRLLESNIKLKIALDRPLYSAWDVADGVEGLSATLPLVGGKNTTAIEMQRYLLEKCKELSGVFEFSKDEMDTLGEWDRVLNALSRFSEYGTEDPVLYQSDWFVRMKTNERIRQRHPELTPSEMGNLDLRFDLIPGGVGVSLRKEGRIYSGHCPSEKKIKSAINRPPSGRAVLRGKAIRLGKLNLNRVNWDSLETDRAEISMPLIGDYSKPAVDEALKLLFG